MWLSTEKAAAGVCQAGFPPPEMRQPPIVYSAPSGSWTPRAPTSAGRSHGHEVRAACLLSREDAEANRLAPSAPQPLAVQTPASRLATLCRVPPQGGRSGCVPSSTARPLLSAGRSRGPLGGEHTWRGAGKTRGPGRTAPPQPSACLEHSPAPGGSRLPGHGRPPRPGSHGHQPFPCFLAQS